MVVISFQRGEDVGVSGDELNGVQLKLDISLIQIILETKICLKMKEHDKKEDCFSVSP